MVHRSAFLLALVISPSLVHAEDAAKFDDLPHKMSSLGACVNGGYVYVYGGHSGNPHSYSKETTSGKFYRAKLSGGKWEELTAGPAVQGLALVAYKGKVYRVGGMQPRNKPGDESDLHSLKSFAVYDPATKKWQDLTDLPEGRSSHEAVVVGDRLYVFGGWSMKGSSEQRSWHKTGLVIDLSKSDAKWQSIEQPFQRRALAVESLDGKVYVIGGLSDSGKGAKTRVDVYDPATEKWSESAEIPNKSTTMGTGFSPAACIQGGRLFISTNDGLIHRLSKDKTKWEPVGKQQQARFVPRMLPGEKGALIVVGGNAKADAQKVEVIQPK